MKNFTKQEAKIVGIILFAIFAVSLQNFRISIRRARDAQRKADVRSITNALAEFQEDFGFYPPSSKKGEILSCADGQTTPLELAVEEPNLSLEDKLRLIYRPCQWGEDPLRDISDLNYPEYLKKIPVEPDGDKGATYYYVSTLNHYQLFASLEGKTEAEYDLAIEERNLPCGSRICNFGLASGTVPLDKGLEEYENELSKDND